MLQLVTDHCRYTWLTVGAMRLSLSLNPYQGGAIYHFSPCSISCSSFSNNTASSKVRADCAGADAQTPAAVLLGRLHRACSPGTALVSHPRLSQS